MAWLLFSSCSLISYQYLLLSELGWKQSMKDLDRGNAGGGLMLLKANNLMNIRGLEVGGKHLSSFQKREEECDHR
jgi:hypothetical protein